MQPPRTSSGGADPGNDNLAKLSFASAPNARGLVLRCVAGFDSAAWDPTHAPSYIIHKRAGSHSRARLDLYFIPLGLTLDY